MTKEEMAAALNGCEYPFDVSKSYQKLAKDNELLIMFGASDDCCELRGMITDELGANLGTTFLLKDGMILPQIDEHEDEDVLKKHGVLEIVKAMRASAVSIEQVWCESKDSPAWTYKTDAPHAKFDIMEDGEVFCRGIVIDLKELK